MNKVQGSLDGNRMASNINYSTEQLAEFFNKGYKINVKSLKYFVPNSVHQEVDIDFVTG